MMKNSDQRHPTARCFCGVSRLELNGLSYKNSLRVLFEKRAQLHLKAQQVVSQWIKLSEAVPYIDAKQGRPPDDEASISKKGMLTGTLILGCLAVLYAAAMESFLPMQPVMIRLSIWLGLGVYGVLLCHWHHQPFLGRLLLPRWIGFSSAWISMTVMAYLFLTIGILIWIRSGLTSAEGSLLLKELGLDLLISYGSVTLILWLLDVVVISAAWSGLIFFGFQCIHLLFAFRPIQFKKVV
jgi:hypothetical protein